MRSVHLPLTLLMGIVIVFYFSWLPNPELALPGVLPIWLSRWTDTSTNMNIRTAVPFFIISLLSGFWLPDIKQAWQKWFGVWMLLVVVVVVAEAGQLLLPLRHFDWGDIAWGATGVLGGLLVSGSIVLLTRKQKRKQVTIRHQKE